MYNPKDLQIVQNSLESNGVKINADANFQLRLGAIIGLLREKLHFLYAHRHNIDDLLKSITEVMVNAHKNRSDELLAADLERVKDPHWFCNEKIVGMMLYVDRFAGDLEKLQKRVEYLDELGINLVHLMPILKAPEKNNDGGYAISDYRSIDPKYGTMDQLKAFASTLHRKEMLLMFDLVVNHTSDEHEWVKKARSGNEKFQGYYYMYNDRTIPDQFEQTMPQVFPESAPGNFTYDKASGKWVMTVFHNYQWDLNYTNPQVFIEMLDILLNILNQGVDIVRLDALAFLWKKIGTTSQNLNEAHVIIQAFKACCQIVAPGAVILAEAIVAPVEIVRYFGSSTSVSNECDVAYNATLMTLLWDAIATKNNRLLMVSLQRIPQKPIGTTWLNYIRCHDDIGLGYDDEHAKIAGYESYAHRKFLSEFLIGQYDWSFAAGMPFMTDPATGFPRISGALASLTGLEKAMNNNDPYAIDMATARINMLHSIIISYGGMPMIYAGDELATINDYSFLQEPDKSYDNRWVHRPKMDWERAKKRSDGKTVEHKTFAALQKMIQVRKSSPEFADQDNRILIDAGNQHLFAYIRYHNDIKTLVVCNLNDRDEAVYMKTLTDLGFDSTRSLVDKYTSKKVVFEKFKLVLKPYQFIWISQ